MTPGEWLQERLDNTRWIAAAKTGADRDGWLEDALYLSTVIAERERLLEACKEALAFMVKMPGCSSDLNDKLDEIIAKAEEK